MEEQKVEQKAPWEQDWIAKPIQAVREFVGDAVKALKEPWEREWKQKPALPITPSPKAPVAPSKGFDMDSYLQTTAEVESSGNPNAKAKTSSAKGLFQFTAGTWNDMVNSMDLNYTLKDRADPEKAREVMRAFTSRNLEKAKKDLGREPTHVEVYMYHFLGRSAPKFLKADGKEPAYKQVTATQARANKSVFFNKDGTPKTVDEVVERYSQRFDKGVVVQQDRVMHKDKLSSDLVRESASKMFEAVEEELSSNTEFTSLKSFLSDRGAVPQLALTYDSGVKGSFTTGVGMPYEGVVAMNPDYLNNKVLARSTYIHEHVHAALRQMRGMWYDINDKKDKTEAEIRFMDTFNKIAKPNRKNTEYDSGLKATARSISSEWVKKEGGYRGSQEELPAFGVGNTVKKYGDKGVPAHVDSTMATMFMILLDQASKLSKGKKNAS